MNNFDMAHEHYRQMLVRDGERRFHQWHQEFIRYQKQFLKDQERRIKEYKNMRSTIS